jgi:hypothetical protein
MQEKSMIFRCGNKGAVIKMMAQAGSAAYILTLDFD